jgi:hypothetical protein
VNSTAINAKENSEIGGGPFRRTDSTIGAHSIIRVLEEFCNEGGCFGFGIALAGHLGGEGEGGERENWDLNWIEEEREFVGVNAGIGGSNKEIGEDRGVR